jgi:hypothetical protein
LRSQASENRAEIDQCLKIYFDALRSESCFTEAGLNVAQQFNGFLLDILTDEEIFVNVKASIQAAIQANEFKCISKPEVVEFVGSVRNHYKNALPNERQLNVASIVENMDAIARRIGNKKICEVAPLAQPLVELKNLEECNNFGKAVERALQILESYCSANEV